MKKVLISVALMSLTSCAAVYNRTYNDELVVKTRVSQDLVLDPVADEQKTVWVDVRNTSDNPAFSVKSDVLTRLADSGYKIVSDPKKANFWLQANIQHLEKVSDASQGKFYNSVTEGAMLGGVTGAMAGRGRGSGPMVLAALGGAALGGLLDYNSQNIKYATLVNVVISEKIQGSGAQESSEQKIATGSSGSKTITATRNLEYNKYNVKIISTAEKVNLTESEATSAMRKGIVSAISNILGG
jgi:hypothetical protein